VVVDPVAGKGAGAQQPRLGGAVGVEGQGEGRPGHWSPDLDVGLMANPTGVGKPVRPPAVWTNRAQVGPISGSGRKSGRATRGERDAGWAVADLGDVDAAVAGLASVHDASVLHLDPGLEPVGQPEAVACSSSRSPGPRGARIEVGDAQEPEVRRLNPSVAPAGSR